MQLLAPCATTLEGTLLGSEAFVWVGARTVASAAAAVAVLLTSSRLHWGLTGIWAGLVTLVAVNCLLDAYKLLSPSTPLALERRSAASAALGEELPEMYGSRSSSGSNGTGKTGQDADQKEKVHL